MYGGPPKRPPTTSITRVSRRLYGKLTRRWPRSGAAHLHLRQSERQGRNNPTCARLTDAELDAQTAGLA